MKKNSIPCYSTEQLIALCKQGVDLNLLFAGGQPPEKGAEQMKPSSPALIYPLGKCPTLRLLKQAIPCSQHIYIPSKIWLVKSTGDIREF